LTMGALSVGSIVRCRNREWIVLPSPNQDIYLLRPLAGADDEIVGIHHRLHDLNLDPVTPAHFPPPDPCQSGDAVTVELLFNSARLTLRDGAGPFRSLGRISVRPRPYQFVPLLMALRLDPVRMLIADDVGVGKTIEALLIARELLDRGEITRLCVLCPPYLCDQWCQELHDKFRIPAVVIRSGTVSQLERELPSGDHSVFGWYPFIVVSIDFAKSDARKANFLQHAPDFVIVDEAHGATDLPIAGRDQQQRHELLVRLAQKPDRHLLLLTATPHSGIESSFLSLLGLLRPDFRNLNLTAMPQEQRVELARHFVQRRRADVAHWLGEDTPFPTRLSEEETYDLSPDYFDLYENVFNFSRELVRTAETLSRWRQRHRYWAALALLRCVMSSPAAAVAALRSRLGQLQDAEPEIEDENELAAYVDDPVDKDSTDAQPSALIAREESLLEDSGQRRLRQFARQAEELLGSDKDVKLVECARIVRELLREGFHPVIWCRYIATSDYVAAELGRRLGPEFPSLRILSVTGALAEEERRQRIEELDPSKAPYRVLVATDCLSEGINLQRYFNAVLHYDLPWNPNRLDQREGRVDRFGQPSGQVKAVLFYGRDNPVDGAVLDVLLRRANAIYNALGVRVPIPVDSRSVMEAIMTRLLSQTTRQTSLFELEKAREVHAAWDRAVEQERVSRTRFAQHAIKPEEVQRELEETDDVLADPATVRRFLENAASRLGLRLKARQDSLELSGFSALPDPIRAQAPQADPWTVSFLSVAPAGAEPVDRNHPFLQAMGRYFMEAALAGDSNAPARRCGVIRTSSVRTRTWVLLCRLRYTISTPNAPDLLAEEVQCFAFPGAPDPSPNWMPPPQPVNLLRGARPEANVSEIERRETLKEFLVAWPAIQKALDPLVKARARQLEEAHKRVRGAVQLARRGTSVARHFPPDLLGVLALLPIPGGVRR
jgi:superfamily II DNA or RNA helicase